MPTWVRKDTNGNVLEKTTQDPSGRFHPSVVWVKLNATPDAAFAKETFRRPADGWSDDATHKEWAEYQKELAEAEANTAPEATANTA
jgi:hypothetical protein